MGKSMPIPVRESSPEPAAVVWNERTGQIEERQIRRQKQTTRPKNLKEPRPTLRQKQAGGCGRQRAERRFCERPQRERAAGRIQ